MKKIKILGIILLLITIVCLFCSCSGIYTPADTYFDIAGGAQENASEMADQVMDNMESIGQFMPNITPDITETTETTTQE